ncbi:hypothetical protein [Priestia abyssalis]|uniref:hypothetical protein n=1 Tax=Priestia abyssalis TaxID=1221450 RepID=UPI0009958C8F|nr:hypothetical protein [Priestia abyssalis]
MDILKSKFIRNKPKRRWSFFIMLIMFVVIVFLFLSPSNVHKIIPGEPSIKTVSQGNPVADTSNIRELVGISDNVFIGKVTEQVGTKSIRARPETQFKVEVLNNIKGDLHETVKVNQQGGYEWNKIILIEGDKLLEKGKTYLFATRYLESENWHTVIPVDGYIQIFNQEEQAKLVEKYSKAYEEEIPFKYEK